MASSSSVYGANKKFPFQEIDKTDHQISFYAATKKSLATILQLRPWRVIPMELFISKPLKMDPWIWMISGKNWKNLGPIFVVS